MFIVLVIAASRPGHCLPSPRLGERFQSQFLNDFGGLALGLAVLGIGIYFLVRQRKGQEKLLATI